MLYYYKSQLKNLTFKKRLDPLKQSFPCEIIAIRSPSISASSIKWVDIIIVRSVYKRKDKIKFCIYFYWHIHTTSTFYLIKSNFLCSFPDLYTVTHHLYSLLVTLLSTSFNYLYIVNKLMKCKLTIKYKNIKVHIIKILTLRENVIEIQ